jgi:hypothetical protein
MGISETHTYFLSENLTGDELGKLRVDVMVTLVYGLGYCQYGDEHSGSLNCGEYLDQLEITIFSRTVLLELVIKLKLNSVAFSPQANYTDRATAACRRS